MARCYVKVCLRAFQQLGQVDGVATVVAINGSQVRLLIKEGA